MNKKELENLIDDVIKRDKANKKKEYKNIWFWLVVFNICIGLGSLFYGFMIKDVFNSPYYMIIGATYSIMGHLQLITLVMVDQHESKRR